MAIRSFLIILITLFFSFRIYANDHENLMSLQNDVLEEAQQHFASRFQSKTFERDVQITVGSLDSRLKLSKCPNALSFHIKESRHTTRHTTVKTSCEVNGTKQWSIFVPVTINVFSQVAIVTESLHKGDVLTRENTGLSRVNTSVLSSGHIENINKVLGKAITRPLRRGDNIRMSYLDEADVVRRGDPVTIEVQSSAISVATIATALNDGYVGEMIKVRNNRSKRVVDAKVTGPGQVLVNW